MNVSAATPEVVCHETIRETDFELVGSGTFIDEDDLTEKYKTKPQQLAAILKNARKIEDPIRECTLYKEMTYVAKTSNKEKFKESSLRSIIQERESKKAKKAKPWPPILDSGEADLKLLTGAQTKMIDGLQKWADTARQKIQDQLGEIDTKSLGEIVSQPIVTRAKAFCCKLAEFKAELDQAVESGTADMKDIKAKNTDLKAMSKEQFRRLTVQVAEATAVKMGV